MRRDFHHSKPDAKYDGDQLVSDFRAAITNIVTLQTASVAAKETELGTLQTLSSFKQQNGLYLTPEDIPAEYIEQLTKNSLDAHLKKVQSEQIASAAKLQIKNSETNAKHMLVGKKASFSVNQASYIPFEAVYYNDQTGEYTTSVLHRRRVSGIIEDISFDSNLVMLRPGLLEKFIFTKRIYLLVHIIDTDTLMPVVTAIC